MCTPDGVHLDLPPDNTSPMMILSESREQHQSTVTAIRDQAQVYWLKLTSRNSFLRAEWTKWQLFIASYYEDARQPTLPLHCTLLYDAARSQKDYEECWDELTNYTTSAVHYEDIIIGPEGTAVAVKLTEEQQAWFQVSNSVPHITLLVAKEYESHHQGPMVKRASQIKEWYTTECQLIQISSDKQFIKINCKQAAEVIAEKVLLPKITLAQMLLSEQHEKLLE